MHRFDSDIQADPSRPLQPTENPSRRRRKIDIKNTKKLVNEWSQRL